MSVEKELEKFLKEHRIEDYFYEFEKLKGETLIKEEKESIDFFYDVIMDNKPEITQALKNDDMEYLKELLKQTETSTEEKVNTLLSLIKKVGAHKIRLALDLLDEEDLKNFKK